MHRGRECHMCKGLTGQAACLSSQACLNQWGSGEGSGPDIYHIRRLLPRVIITTMIAVAVVVTDRGSCHVQSNTQSPQESGDIIYCIPGMRAGIYWACAATLGWTAPPACSPQPLPAPPSWAPPTRYGWTPSGPCAGWPAAGQCGGQQETANLRPPHLPELYASSTAGW